MFESVCIIYEIFSMHSVLKQAFQELDAVLVPYSTRRVTIYTKPSEDIDEVDN